MRSDDATERVAQMPGWEKSALAWRSVRGLPEGPLFGYYSWGSNDPMLLSQPELKLSFVPGALGGTFVSTDARTLQPPPENWRPGTSFGGTSQSLIGNLIRQGITGVSGHVAEPYLTNAARPDILFPAYLRGFNLIEAFYLSIPSVSWQNVVIGDPLCAPFRQDPLPAEDLDPPVDSVTELPRFLSERRVAIVTKTAGDPEAAKFFVRAERMLARNDREAARKAFEDAVRVSPKFTEANVRVAMLLEQGGDIEGAMARYRAILEIAPNNVVALNNLAYALAVHQKKPKEALPLARRALSLAPNSADIADTLGWTHHLLGDNMSAEALLIRAVGLPGTTVDPLVHLAIVFEGNGKKTEARAALERAMKADANVKSRADVKPLIERLGIRAN